MTLAAINDVSASEIFSRWKETAHHEFIKGAVIAWLFDDCHGW